MKKTLVTLMAVMVAAGAFAQGTVTFNNRLTGTLITHVYQAPTTGEAQVFGNTSIDTPAGSTVYTGALLTGAGWIATLWSAPAGTTDSSLLVQATGASSTFRTGTAAGNFVASTATLQNVGADAAAAVLQVRVYSSAFASWALAVQANQNNTFGASALFTVNAIGGLVNTPPAMVGLTSFSLVAVPEPSSMALAGLGAASLLIFRRRK